MQLLNKQIEQEIYFILGFYCVKIFLLLFMQIFLNLFSNDDLRFALSGSYIILIIFIVFNLYLTADAIIGKSMTQLYIGNFMLFAEFLAIVSFLVNLYIRDNDKVDLIVYLLIYFIMGIQLLHLIYQIYLFKKFR